MTAEPTMVVLMTGGSRGIGRAMALRLAQAGAAVVLAAKTDQPHPRLAGTIHSVAAEIEALGGQALPLKVDARDEAQLVAAVQQTLQRFGRLDLLINNAGFLGLTPIEHTSTKAKQPVSGYGQSFFQINRAYVRNVMQVRQAKYHPLMDAAP